MNNMEKKVIILPFFDVTSSEGSIDDIIGREGEFLVWDGLNYNVRSVWMDASNKCHLSDKININSHYILSYETFEKYRLETLSNELTVKTKALNDTENKCTALTEEMNNLKRANEVLLNVISTLTKKI